MEHYFDESIWTIRTQNCWNYFCSYENDSRYTVPRTVNYRSRPTETYVRGSSDYALLLPRFCGFITHSWVMTSSGNPKKEAPCHEITTYPLIPVRDLGHTPAFHYFLGIWPQNIRTNPYVTIVWRNALVRYVSTELPGNSICPNVMKSRISRINGNPLTLRFWDRSRHIRFGRILWRTGSKQLNQRQLLKNKIYQSTRNQAIRYIWYANNRKMSVLWIFALPKVMRIGRRQAIT